MTARLRDDSNMKACWQEERWVRVKEEKFKSWQGVCSTTNRICIHDPVLPGSVFSPTNSGRMLFTFGNAMLVKGLRNDFGLPACSEKPGYSKGSSSRSEHHHHYILGGKDRRTVRAFASLPTG